MVVSDSSGDDHWFAYDTTQFPARLDYFYKSNTSSCDPYGHGTHIAGIIGGDESLGGDYAGVAPGAKIYGVRVLDGEGRGDASDVIAGLDWVLENADELGIKVVNMSLGKAVETRAAEDPLVQAAEAVWDAGITVICSAGNYGRDGHFTITSPGNSPKVITVGSITDEGTGNDSSDDYVSTFSSLGPTAFDHFLKPDLVAPGNKVVASSPASSVLERELPERARGCPSGCGTPYLELSGTSMAAGMVSGTAALMLTNDPTLTPDAIKATLMLTARKVDVDPTFAGAGVLDIEASIAESRPRRLHRHRRHPRRSWFVKRASRSSASRIPRSPGATSGTPASFGTRAFCGTRASCGIKASCGTSSSSVRMPSYGTRASSGIKASCGTRASSGIRSLPIAMASSERAVRASSSTTTEVPQVLRAGNRQI